MPKLLIASLSIVVAGCGAGETRIVTGTVTLDGQPLATGRIEFKPIAPTEGPLAGGSITGGRYEVPAVAQGLKAGGTYRVEITSLAGSGKFARHPAEPSGQREVMENIVPARYNERSELKVTIEDDATRNVFDFKLLRNP